MTLRSAGLRLGVSHLLLSKWRRKSNIPNLAGLRKKSMCWGPLGQLQVIKESVVHRIQEMGVEVIHIPGGCTSLCQPVDVGFNKPFKDCIRTLWTTWMIEEGHTAGITTALTRQRVAEWIDSAMLDMASASKLKQGPSGSIGVFKLRGGD